MESLTFDFKNKEYLFFIKLEEQAEIGIIEIDKKEITGKAEREKTMYLTNISNLDYETLNKLENRVNPKSLVKVVVFMCEATCVHCNSKQRKEVLEKNIKKNYDINVMWKVDL